ncbi:hypothetical protein INT47_001502 [Mucor saturninus]|uniref:Uncharacterized protein n=1 Tax=Mucor saturninus TaxID=64648 RepID=A0A8H7QZD7_9FUNG|nr:hypothetical protein INT47_001502 [Mucor saturninus]
MHIINNTSYDLNDKLDYVSEKLSISYDPVSGDVIDREVSKPSPSHLSKYAIKRCYVRNVFTELHDIYLRKKHGLYDSCMHVRIITQAAIKCLQDQVSIWEERLKCSRLDLHFVFTLPTSWDYEMQNNLIRPLFIQAGLINEKDHNDRLLFFSKLDLAYQSIKYYYQECHDHMKLKIGKQYAICSLDYDDGVSVDLELFSVRYPLSTATDNEYVPLSLKSVSFTFPFDLDINYARLERLFEKRCNAIVTPEFIDIMKLQTDVDKLVEDNTNEDGFNLMREKFMNIDFQMFLNYQPFEELEDLIYGNFNLSQTEIENIESITVNDMYEELSHCVKIDFMNQISDLLTDTDGIKVSELFICFSEEFVDIDNFVLLKLIEKWLKDYGDQQGSYRIITPGLYSPKGFSFFIDRETVETGTRELVKKKFRESCKHRDPKIVFGNTKVESFKPVYYINADILPTTVNLLLTQTEENNQAKNVAEKDQLDIQPLSNFFIHPNVYGRQVLCISIWMKLFIKDNFGEYLELYLDSNQRAKITNELVSSESNILEQILSKIGTKKIFSKKYISSAGDDRLVNVCHPEENLNSNYDNDWKNRNTAFAFSVEKKLFDKVFGSDETMDELLVASGILQVNNKKRKVRVSIYGEEIIHAIQHKLKDVNFKMKSYFVVAQVHSNHIQLTLHQVVKLATYEGNAATIIVEDKIIHMEDVYDTLYKTILETLISSSPFDCCSMHESEGSGLHNLNLLRVYKNAYQQFKILLINALSMDQTTIFDMDSKHEFKVSDECSCKITLLLRDIIENGIKPVIQDITTTIAASMANTELFGHYEVGSLFILGNPFSLSKCSPLYAAYTMIVQKEISIAMELKEKDINGFVLQESFCQLLEPVTLTRPYMYDRFIRGVLTVVSNETYGIHMLGDSRPLRPKCAKRSDTVAKDGEYLVFLQKGEPIPKTGLATIFEIVSPQSETKIQGFVRMYLIYKIVELPPLTDPVPGIYTTLEKDINGFTEIYIIDYDDWVSHNPIILDIKRVNYNNTLQILFRWLGYCDRIRASARGNLMVKEDPLTLAYI